MSDIREELQKPPLNDGEWDIVADVEAAGVVDEVIRSLGLQDRLKVRTHPWLPAGAIIAFNPDVRRGRLRRDTDGMIYGQHGSCTVVPAGDVRPQPYTTWLGA